MSKAAPLTRKQRVQNEKPFALRNPIYGDSEPKMRKEPAKPKKDRVIEADSKKKSNYVPEGLSKKLLQQAREQQIEENTSAAIPIPAKEKKSAAAIIEELTNAHNEQAHYDEDELEVVEEELEGEEIEEIEISPEDEAALMMFMGGRVDFSSSMENSTLDIGNIIMSKIKEKEALLASGRPSSSYLEPKIIQVYSQVAAILKKYTSGKIPRAVKIIPLLENWEDILFLTKPSEWSPQATCALTKSFSANFTEKMAQHYFNVVLLPTVKSDIHKHKKLNYHYYQALRQATHKPKAFYKGIILPLCESDTTTLREAIILSSVLVRCTIPSIISSVALLKISTLPYSGPNSIFIKTIIDKKYALPYRVIDAMVAHFMEFVNEQRVLPVLWHQSLLSFAQRYKEELTAQQKHDIKALIRDKSHPKISPEISRELTQSKCRGEHETEMEM